MARIALLVVLAVTDALAGCNDRESLGAPADLPASSEPPAAYVGHRDSRSDGLNPAALWKQGQRWRTLAVARDLSLKWIHLEYQVLAVSDDGSTNIRAFDPTSSKLDVLMTFDAAGRLTSHDAAGGVDGIRPAALVYWPRMPLLPSEGTDGRERERVRRDGEIFRVDADLGKNPAADVEHLLGQLEWQHGRPWFEFMRVDSVHDLDRTRTPDVVFMEQLVQWDPPTAPQGQDGG
jgi:hypothetical protein